MPSTLAMSKNAVLRHLEEEWEDFGDRESGPITRQTGEECLVLEVWDDGPTGSNSFSYSTEVSYSIEFGGMEVISQ